MSLCLDDDKWQQEYLYLDIFHFLERDLKYIFLYNKISLKYAF